MSNSSDKVSREFATLSFPPSGCRHVPSASLSTAILVNPGVRRIPRWLGRTSLSSSTRKCLALAPFRVIGGTARRKPWFGTSVFVG